MAELGARAVAGAGGRELTELTELTELWAGCMAEGQDQGGGGDPAEGEASRAATGQTPWATGPRWGRRSGTGWRPPCTVQGRVCSERTESTEGPEQTSPKKLIGACPTGPGLGILGTHALPFSFGPLRCVFEGGPVAAAVRPPKFRVPCRAHLL